MSHRFELLKHRHKSELKLLKQRLLKCKKPTILRELILDCAALFINIKCGWCHEDRTDIVKHIKRALKENK